MQITIDLATDLEQDLISQAAQLNVPLQTLILETLCQHTQMTSGSTSHWSDVVLSYKGIPDFPAIESHRDRPLENYTLTELEALWQQAKVTLRDNRG